MGKYDPIAYTYEADYHCEDCAEKAHGRDEHGDIVGEEVGAVAPWDEWYNIGEGNQTMICGTCHKEIETYEEDE